MYAEDLAWLLSGIPAADYLLMPFETLKEYEATLQRFDPTLNSDVAYAATFNCFQKVKAALKQLDTDLSR